MSPYPVLSSDLVRLMKLDDASSDLNSKLGPDSTPQATSWLKVLNMEPKDDNWLLFGDSRDLFEDCKFVGHLGIVYLFPNRFATGLFIYNELDRTTLRLPRSE
jgi:hypothetical protein